MVRNRDGCATLNLVVQRLGLVAPAVTLWTRRISTIAAEQNSHMHLVGVALQPAEESPHPVPAVIVVIVVVATIAASFAFDHKMLVRLRQFLEWNVHLNFFS